MCMCVQQAPLLKNLFSKDECGFSSSYDDLQCTIGLEVLFLTLEAGISETCCNFST